VRAAVAVLIVAGAATSAAADPANRVEVSPAQVDAVVARLAGHRIEISARRDAVTIVDAAGEGPPRVGVIERDGDDLVMVTADGRWRLAGPLARPRIAGPGYTVWVIGDVDAAGAVLRARRLGVLLRPARAVTGARRPSTRRSGPPTPARSRGTAPPTARGSGARTRSSRTGSARSRR
jgi:hypothetical protein